MKELTEKIDQYVQNSKSHPHPSGPLPQTRSLPKSSDYVNVFPGQDTSFPQGKLRPSNRTTVRKRALKMQLLTGSQIVG